MRSFEGGATRDDSDGKYDYEGFLSPLVLKRYAEYMHAHRIQTDGGLRASDNWQKGMPRQEYVKSLLRHVMELWEDHRAGVYDPIVIDTLCAIMFNAQGLLYEIQTGRDIKAP